MPARPAKILLCCALATGTWLLQAALASEEDSLAEQRQLFQESYANIQTGKDSGNDTERLREYVLYPYIEAARIQRTLRGVTDADLAATADASAEAFVARFPREPVAREVRRGWLASLVLRREWDKFLSQYHEESADDTQRCHSFTARIELQRTEQLESAVARQWLTALNVPACEPAFAWLRAQNLLSPSIERRARLALSRGNTESAKQLTPLLPVERAVPLQRWIALLEQPARTLDTLLAQPTETVEAEALLAGFKRLVRQDRDGAMLRFEMLKQARGWNAQQTSPYALALAFGLAWDRRPETLQYFSQVLPTDFNDEAYEWRARAALWAGDWTLATQSITEMPSALRLSTRWRYWEARAAEHSQDAARAQQLFLGVIKDDNFYSAMAAARLGRRVAPHFQKLRMEDAKLQVLEQQPALIRARELYRCKLRSLALAEWNFGYAQLPETSRTQAIHLSARWGWHDQTITVAAQRGVFKDYKLLYPRPYGSEVRSAAKLTGLESELIYGVMRQESLYRSDAVSPAGARGLLQLLPETAQRIAKELKQPRPHPDDLFKPEVNIILGASQLQKLTEKFGGMRMMALAGYNAGPNAARRWQPDQPVDSDVWVENIPYTETRGYVQRVLWHSVVFAWLRTGKAQKTDAWVASVQPVGDGTLLTQR